jgi:DNA-binding response OmpR family regulator
VERRRTGAPVAIAVSSDPEALRVLADSAAISGFDLHVVTDGAQAVSLALCDEGAVLVLDLDCSFHDDALDPLGVLLLLRGDARGRRTPALVFGRVRTGLQAELTEAYGALCLASPLSESALIEQFASLSRQESVR